MSNSTDILLESGTNEVEIAEFLLCGQSFGVNVAKVREFIPYNTVELTSLPNSHPSVPGMFMLRGKAIPLINLHDHLELVGGARSDMPVIVVTEFNKMTTGYVADEIKAIHRVTWEEFHPLSSMMSGDTSQVTGTINKDGHEILVLDLEQIVGEIFPETVVSLKGDSVEIIQECTFRCAAKMVFAEDSKVIRTQISTILRRLGYENLAVFDNGQSAFDHLMELKAKSLQDGRPFDEYATLLLTDIEMPRMDGLTLCRRLKKDEKLSMPVVMFSSLINDQMIEKCRRVGADAYAAKPETVKLVELIDYFHK